MPAFIASANHIVNENQAENAADSEKELLIQEIKGLRSEIKALREIIEGRNVSDLAKTRPPSGGQKQRRFVILVGSLYALGIILGIIYLLTRHH